MAGLKLRSRFTFPYFSGNTDLDTAALTGEVPGRYDVALDGVPYMIDQANQNWGDQSIPRTRAQSDGSKLPSEQSLNPDGPWRRSQESWQKGAGQRFLDMEDSDQERFFASKGIDPWERGKIKLLPDVDKKRTSANTNLRLEPAGAKLYLLDGNTLLSTANVTVDSPTWTTVTTGGTAISSPTSLTGDGVRVYVSDGTDIYMSATSGTTYVTAMGSPTPASVIRYVKGRLVAGAGAAWKEIKGTPGSFTSVDVMVSTNSSFTWVDFVGSGGQIYAAGFSGDKSLIYRAAVAKEGDDLDGPVVAGELPDGEIVRSLGFYLGFLMIGTDNGLRFAVPDQNGDLQIGQLLSTGQAVRGFEGQDRFVWFGWTNYDATSTGLGRLDLSVLNDLTPGYASDLMATAQGAVLDVVTFQDIRVFTVSGNGVWAQDSPLVATGQIDSGWFSYGVTEPKIALFLDTTWAKVAGSIQPSFAVDDETADTIGALIVTSSSAAGSASASLRQQRGRLFEVRYELFRDSGDHTQGPQIVRWTTRSQQAAQPGVKRMWPLFLHERLQVLTGEYVGLNVETARQNLEDLHRTTRVVLAQDGGIARQVVVDDFQWIPYRAKQQVREGTWVAVLKEIS